MTVAPVERGSGTVPATALTVLGIGIVAAAVAHDVQFDTGELMTVVVAMPGVLLLAGLVYVLWSSLDAATYWTVARWVFGSLLTLGGGVAVVVYLGADLGGTGVTDLERTTLQILFFSGLGTVGGLLVGLQSIRAVEAARRAEEARTNALVYAAERDRLSQLGETSHSLLGTDEEVHVAELLAEGIERAIPDADCAVWLNGQSGLEPAIEGTPAAPDRTGGDGFRDGEERIVSAPNRGERLYVPLSEHGLLAVTLPPNREFDDRRRDLVVVYARTGQTALDRAAHQRALERQNERLDEFASVVSHDLRSPLSVIVGRAELARETGDLGHIDDVLGAAERMDRLIEDVLALARDGEDAADHQRVPLREAAVNAWDAVSVPEASFDTAEGLPTVEGDPERLQRLFENLFRNSVEHGSTTPRSQAREDSVEHSSTSNRAEPDDPIEHGGEHVSVSVVPLESGCAVLDDGPGIPAEERERVFERGFSTGGTGLGLAIVEDIAESHGGTVSVTESEAGGARIEIRGLSLTGEHESFDEECTDGSASRDDDTSVTESDGGTPGTLTRAEAGDTGR